MILIRTKEAMRRWSLAQKGAGKSIGFVPTMGALHEGHASLMRASAAENDVSVVSIFVNPAQFAPHEDFDAYPRTFEDDAVLSEACGMTVIYAPEMASMYPAGYATYVTVEGLSEGLCSRTRPHFFRGVATVVAKLFNTVLPDRAYFGQKDAQQCAIITRMAADLDMGVSIVEMPIVREADGLAMSSRNKYLSAEERGPALSLSRALREAEALLLSGERRVEAIDACIRGHMAPVKIDYVEIVHAETMKPLQVIDGPVLIAVAANMGRARLIDNLKFDTARHPQAAVARP
ncbi:MAG: pantoate--beta-alanine ligase [Candidatus Hydrogenedentes bacterium]|nr:pantoate--beta-alanine ligase [Candidatus Hydrogenedentota bacterium]